jgi:tetratricopeptide (TPR) repeat protein
MNKIKSPIMPYKGLMPYSDSKEDARFFFGREQKKQIIIANLIASRLTLLYGPSGVGKSSVVRAGAAFQLQQQARETRNQGKVPKSIVVVFDAWRDQDPLASLVKSIQDAIALTLPKGFATIPLSAKNLLEGIASLTIPDPGNKQKPTVDLLVILDQFEEYFLYHGNEDGEGTFAVEFPRLVNHPRLGISFLISMRDDSTTKLDRFKGRIPNLFANRLSVEHLNTNAAREAIVRPLKEYNSLVVNNGEEVIDPEQVDRILAQSGGQVGIEPQLVREILSEVRTGQVSLGQVGGGSVKGQIDGSEDIPVETPFLQLVLTRLWEEEVPKGSKVLRLATLQRLGGAENIVKSHLDKVMNKLTRSEQDTAALIFYQLVTPSGSKIAHSVRDLSFFSKLPPQQISDALAKLVDTNDRILRSVVVPGVDKDQPPEPRYEIFHDVLGSAVLDWRSRHEHKQDQERIAAEALKKRDEERLLAAQQAAEQQRQLKLAQADADAERQRAEQQQQLAEALDLKARAEQQKVETEQKRAYEHLKSAKRLRGLAAALLILMIASLGMAAFAMKQRSDANRFAEESKELRRQAVELKEGGLKARHDADQYRLKGEKAQSAADAESKKNIQLIEDAKIRQQEAAQAVTAANIALANLKHEKLLTAQQRDIRTKIEGAQRAERRGDRSGAIDRYESLRGDFKRLEDDKGEAGAYYNIGDIYRLMSLEDPEEETESTSEEQESKAEWLKLYRQMAIVNLTKASDIYQLIKADPEMADTLTTLAGMHEAEDKETAIAYFKRALPLYRGHDLSAEVFTLEKLGSLIGELEDLDQAEQEARGDEAIGYYRQTIPLYTRLKEEAFFPEEEAVIETKMLKAYDEIAEIESSLNRKREALQDLKQALHLSHADKDPIGVSTRRRDIAELHSELGERTQAIENFLEALKLIPDKPFVNPVTKRNSNLRRVRGMVFISIGNEYHKLKQRDKALEYYEMARAIGAPPYFGTREGAVISPITKRLYQTLEAEALGLIAQIHLEMKEDEKAITEYRRALAIYEETKNELEQITTLRALGKLYEARQDAQAADFYRRAQELENKQKPPKP